MAVTNQSGCMVQHQWAWSNNVNSNRWTTPIEYYRLRNPYYPGSGTISESFSVVETRNKVRGNGKALSILFSTEPGKHCTIYGWSINMQVDGNV